MRIGLLIPLVLGLLVLMAVPAGATPVGAPGYNLDQLSFSVSASVGFAMRDVHLRADEGRGDEAYSSRLAVRGTFAPLRWLDVSGFVGTADWRMRDADFESVLGVLYGGGLRLRLFPWFWEEEGLFNLEMDGQVAAISTKAGDVDGDIWDRDVEAEYWEYQVSLIASKRFEVFIPFLGFCYDQMGVNFSPGGSRNVESDFNWGVFMGLDYYLTPLVYFSAELRVFTETALYLGVGFTY